LKEVGILVKDCCDAIKNYDEADIDRQFAKQKKDQANAFYENYTAMVKKLQELGQKINEKQKMYADLAIQSARASMASFSKGGQDSDQFMVNGATVEEE